MKSAYSIENIKAFASAKGGKCLSTHYINSRTKMLWECTLGHQWYAVWGSIKYNCSWCPDCAISKKLNLGVANEVAHNNSGLCLSLTYLNSKSLLLWQCAEGHKWQASLGSVKKRSWCPFCKKNRKYTLERIQEIVGFKGGKCLSTEYINSNTKMLWECVYGHQWEARWVRINNKKGSWCPTCSNDTKSKTNIPLTLEEAQKIATINNGKCLSTVYINNHTKMLWKCHKGHEWHATMLNIKQDKTWCPYCSNRRKLTLEDAQNLAKRNNGKCLSREYVDTHTRMLWECAHGHQWYAELNSIKTQGTWCLQCLRRG